MFSYFLVEYRVIVNYSLFVFVKGSNIFLKFYFIVSYLDVVLVINELWEVFFFEGRI